MAELPILPLDVRALLADTMHMTAEEFGAYTRILYTLWIQGGMLPDNSEQMRRIAGVHPPRWPRVEETVMRPFTREGGLLSQKRLLDTALRVREKRRKLAEAGAKGRRRRFGVIDGGKGR